MKIGARRIFIGLVLGVGGLGSTFIEPLFALLVFSIALGSLYEFARLSERKGPVFAYPIAFLGILFYVGLTYFRVIHRFEGVLLAATVVGALGYATFTERGNYLARSSYTLLGVLYIGKLLSYFIEIRSIPQIGTLLTVYVIVLVAVTDIAAMLTGVRIGRTPLTRLSPKKTVEGAAGGLLAAIGCGVLIGSMRELHLLWWQGAFIGAVTSFAAQAGDIVESALKRDARVKDTGSAIAGHGGVLDRFDSFMFGGIAFYFALWLVGLTHPDLQQFMHAAQTWSG